MRTLEIPVLTIYLVVAALVAVIMATFASRYGDEPVEAGLLGLLSGFLWPLFPIIAVVVLVSWLLGKLGELIRRFVE